MKDALKLIAYEIELTRCMHIKSKWNWAKNKNTWEYIKARWVQNAATIRCFFNSTSQNEEMRVS